MIEWNFIRHESYPEWGHSIYIMESSGFGFVRVYYYYCNYCPFMYLDMLSVDNSHRNMGLGQALLDDAEQIAYNYNVSEIRLFVKKDSWMHDWYERNGYVDNHLHDYEPDCIWMYKKIK